MSSASKLALLLLVSCGAPRSLPEPDAQLHFVDRVHGGEHTMTKRDLRNLTLVTSYDPYYGREKRFWATPLAPLLRNAFPELDGDDILLKASDDYAVPFTSDRLLDGTAWIAVADADHVASWDAVGPRHADPAPFYLVWSGPDRADVERFPRPWALAEISRVPFERVYPHVVPSASATDTVRRGFALFRKECVACHAVNREGGRIGPDLNVPQSIVEYRPREQIRAYIRDPLVFRYSTMPSHPDLSDADLDALLAYFDEMRAHKYDPERK